jgi:hypothetical protein
LIWIDDHLLVEMAMIIFGYRMDPNDKPSEPETKEPPISMSTMLLVVDLVG